MSSVKTWSTKKQVMTDLARASGRRLKNIDDLDEGYLVIGDAPPPVFVEQEDDEMQLLFSGAAYRKTAPIEDNTPDLKGIQQMLRMVQDSGGDDNDDVNTTTNPTDCIIAITKASNLNPNVVEFIPKSATPSSVSISKNIDLTSQSRSTINNEDVSINVDDDVINIDPKNVVTQSDDVIVEDSSNILKDNDVSSENIGDKKLNEHDSEYQSITSKLKDKISEAAKSDTFELKKQKNVAIATLLRLYAGGKNVNKTTTEVKLITPDFYESKNDNNDLKVVTKAPQTPSSSSSTVDPQTTYTSISIPTGSSTSISSTPPQTSETRSTPIKVDPEIKRSIEKVNKWLGEPAVSKTPAVCLGPIAFKKKDPQNSNCKSPNTSEQKTTKPSANGQRYQPSNYAADLGRKYMERNKIKEQQENRVTWTNLENILKEKDETIRKRLEEQASRSAHDSDESLAPQL